MLSNKKDQPEIDYEKEYNRLATEFWNLQQIKQTEEEKKYESLCKDLEKMAIDYRTEIDELAKQNSELNGKCSEISELKKTLKKLEEKEQIIRSVLSTFQ